MKKTIEKMTAKTSSIFMRVAMTAVLVFGMAACGKSKEKIKKEEQEKRTEEQSEIIMDSEAGLNVFKDFEAVVKHIDSLKPENQPIEIAISNDFTFNGEADTNGAGMGVLIAKIAAIDYKSHGFKQKGEYKLYLFKMKEE